jgi:hypothetical protein
MMTQSSHAALPSANTAGIAWSGVRTIQNTGTSTSCHSGW